MICGGERFRIGSEELLQRLWIPASDLSNAGSTLTAFLTVPKVLPKVGQMIECMRIHSLLHCFRPLLVRDRHIANRPPDSLAKRLDDLAHCWSFAYQWVYRFGGQVGACQKSCCDSGYVFGAGERNNSISIAQGQERCTLFGHTSADERTHIFVIGRRLYVNCSNLSPIQNSIGETMLEISE